MNLKNFLNLSFLAVVLLVSPKVMAVPPPPSSPPPASSTPSTPTGIPLDGGVLLLAAAGAIYGARNIYQRRSSK